MKLAPCPVHISSDASLLTRFAPRTRPRLSLLATHIMFRRLLQAVALRDVEEGRPGEEEGAGYGDLVGGVAEHVPPHYAGYHAVGSVHGRLAEQRLLVGVFGGEGERRQAATSEVSRKGGFFTPCLEIAVVQRLLIPSLRSSPLRTCPLSSSPTGAGWQPAGTARRPRLRLWRSRRRRCSR